MEQLNLFGEKVGLKETKRTKNETFNDYNNFVDKFEIKKTTDDCYTPKEVYDVVLRFVHDIYDMEGVTVVRPFFPGGDFENFEYPEKCAVVDNPPFSIISKIIRFYCAHNIKFFLFAPALTLFSAADCDVSYIVCGASVKYENKAVVSTRFVTNMLKEERVWVCPRLVEEIKEAQAEPDKTRQKFTYPDHIITAATIQKLAHHSTELKIKKVSCEYISDSDVAKQNGRSLFGGGFILSERAAAERAAAERAAAERAAAERAAATKLNLSGRERNIVDKLNKKEVYHGKRDI
jgi:hypothetical protein